MRTQPAGREAFKVGVLKCRLTGMSVTKELTSVILVLIDQWQADLPGHDIVEGSNRPFVIARTLARTAVCYITAEVDATVAYISPANDMAWTGDSPVDASRVAGDRPVIPAPGGLHLEPEQGDAEHIIGIFLTLCGVTGIASAVSIGRAAGSG